MSTHAGGGFDDPSAEVSAEAAAAFGLLSTPARLHLVRALSQGESDGTGLAELVGGTLPSVSQHLTKLKLAGLVRSRREGRRQVYLADDPDVVTVVRLMVGQLAARAGHAPRSTYASVTSASESSAAAGSRRTGRGDSDSPAQALRPRSRGRSVRCPAAAARNRVACHGSRVVRVWTERDP